MMKKISMTIDSEIWQNFGKICAKVGMKKSTRIAVLIEKEIKEKENITS